MGEATGLRRPDVAGASVIAGAALVAGSICTRFGVFFAGVAASDDPAYTVRPQRARLDAREETESGDLRGDGGQGA